MPRKPAMSLTSLLTGGALIASAATAQAGGMSHIGTWSGGRIPIHAAAPICGGTHLPAPHSSVTNINVYKPVSVRNSVNVYKPTTINSRINVYKPVTINKSIDASKTISINKPVTITNNINAAKTIDINKNIDASKNIAINKNININKNIVINKGGGGADASAIATAIAEAQANAGASATVNFYGGAAAQSGASINYFGSTILTDTPGPAGGGDIGNLSVEVAPAQPQQCVYQDATVIKAIHAVCVSPDGHEFPASHMVPDTWIDASYEGEVARCIPGATLKVVVGEVVRSSEGMATSYSKGQVLRCGPHEAVRHYKNGMLKCAPAVPVPDCTERTNLRKWGSGDMFFTYRTKVCLETGEEMSQAD